MGGAGGVESVLRGADGQAGGEARFVVVVVAGGVDRELPLAGGGGIPQSAQRVHGAVGQSGVDVAEVPWVADVQAGDLRPAVAGPGAQPLFQGGLGGVWISGHGSQLLLASCAIAVAWCRELAQLRHKDQRLRRIERMPMPSPYQIALSGDERAVLTTRARSVRGSYRDRLRAAIVLAAAAGLDNAAIAPALGACTAPAPKCRPPFAEGRL